MTWFPTEAETFVFVHVGDQRIVVLIPGGEQPESITVHTPLGPAGYVLDEAMTEKTRMYVRVAERRRRGID